MSKIRSWKFLSFLAVFTALFASCEEPQDDGNNINFKCLKTLEGHTATVTSVTYSPDGTRIVSGSWDWTIKIWNANTGECLKTLKDLESVSSVAYSPDGTKIISGSDYKTIKIWQAAARPPRTGRRSRRTLS